MTRVLPLALLVLVAGCAADPAPQPRSQPQQEPPPPSTTEETEAVPVPMPLEHVDETEGAVATLVYVTEQGRRGAAQPAAIILSSDPDNPHFSRRNSARVTVHKLTRAEMAELLQELTARGLDRLPWVEQAYDAEIGPQRAFYLYRAGARRGVEKEQAPEAQRQTFTDVERRVIERTSRPPEAEQE